MKYIRKLIENNHNKNIITLYHGSPYLFNEFKDSAETGNYQSGHICNGISFTDKYELAKLFADIYPKEYYELLNNIKEKYPNIDDLINRKEKRESLLKDNSNISNLEKDLEDKINKLTKSWENYKELNSWLTSDENRLWNKFELENKYSLKELDNIKSEIKRLKHIIKYYEPLSDIEEKYIIDYQKELNILNNDIDKKYGYVYTCEVSYNNIIEYEGQDIGFGSSREECVISDGENGDLVKINNSDTGMYIGTEYILLSSKELLKNIKIIKRDKV